MKPALPVTADIIVFRPRRHAKAFDLWCHFWLTAWGWSAKHEMYGIGHYRVSYTHPLIPGFVLEA